MRLFLRLFLIFLGLAGWVAAGLLGLVLYGFLYRPWDDPISGANRVTGALLAYHEQYPQTRIVIDWLNAYHGEAPSMQVMYTFVDWAIDHKADAERLLFVEMAEPQLFAKRLAFAASDSGRGCKFRAVFARSSTPLIISTLAEIQSLPVSNGCELGVATPNKIQTRLPGS